RAPKLVLIPRPIPWPAIHDQRLLASLYHTLPLRSVRYGTTPLTVRQARSTTWRIETRSKNCDCEVKVRSKDRDCDCEVKVMSKDREVARHHQAGVGAEVDAGVGAEADAERR